MKTCLISGITGQDGSILAKQMLDREYHVYGLVRRTSNDNTQRIKDINDSHFHLVEGDLTDASSVSGIINKIQPTEIYHLGAMSHVGISFEQPSLTISTNVLSTVNLLESVRHHSPNSKMLHASSSEMFGNNFGITVFGYNKDTSDRDNYYTKLTQSENTTLMPRSPYGVSKMASHHLLKVYREAYNIFACSSICFNHESEVRGDNFVSRKITKYVGNLYRFLKDKIVIGTDEDNILAVNRKDALDIGKDNCAVEKMQRLHLGNISSHRDWGHAKDYTRAMYLMLQNDKPEDFVISTGETHSIEEFLEIAFAHINIKNWRDYIVIDPKFYRPAEVDRLIGDSTKIREKLKWEPQVTFKELVSLMLQNDILHG